jgi:hypothetical protein
MLLLPLKANALISSCSYNGSGQSSYDPAAESFTVVDIYNNSPNLYANWVSIESPNATEYPIRGGSAYQWTATATPAQITYTDGSMQYGKNLNFSFDYRNNLFPTPPQQLIIKMSDTGSSLGATTCTGNASLETREIAPTPPPDPTPPPTPTPLTSEITERDKKLFAMGITGLSSFLIIKQFRWRS